MGFSHTHRNPNIGRENRVLVLESEAMRDSGSIPTGSNILSLDFILFSHSKDENANIGIYNVCADKPDSDTLMIRA